VAEIIALKPFIAPFEEIVGPELHNLKKKFEASVMRIYRMIPRYSKPIVP
jgi:Mor family transcriptional regulator